MKGPAALGSRTNESFQYLFVLKERSTWKVSLAFKWQPGQPWGIRYGLSGSTLFSVMEIHFVLWLSVSFLLRPSQYQLSHLSLIATLCVILCPAGQLAVQVSTLSPVTSRSPGPPTGRPTAASAFQPTELPTELPRPVCFLS